MAARNLLYVTIPTYHLLPYLPQSVSIVAVRTDGGSTYERMDAQHFSPNLGLKLFTLNIEAWISYHIAYNILFNTADIVYKAAVYCCPRFLYITILGSAIGCRRIYLIRNSLHTDLQYCCLLQSLIFVYYHTRRRHYWQYLTYQSYHIAYNILFTILLFMYITILGGAIGWWRIYLCRNSLHTDGRMDGRTTV